MTALTELADEINDWLKRDFESDVVQSWISMAEYRLSQELRIADMVQIDTATITEARVNLPNDWLEMDFIRIIGGRPLSYTTRETLYTAPATDTAYNYSITGNYLIFGGTPDETDGKNIELSYYGLIPNVGNAETWLSTKHRLLLIQSAIIVGNMYAIEDERIPLWKEDVVEYVNKLNDNHNMSKVSGSMLNAPRRSKRGFG